MNKRSFGNAWEERVIAHLSERGMRILEHGFYCRFGEIDIIAQEKNVLVFVEVKYRGNTNYGMPQDAVDYAKKRRISESALYYLQKNHFPLDTPCRFDVAAVSASSIEIIENAFEYCGRWNI